MNGKIYILNYLFKRDISTANFIYWLLQFSYILLNYIIDENFIQISFEN
jgi:hypothetical protein